MTRWLSQHSDARPSPCSAAAGQQTPPHRETWEVQPHKPAVPICS